MGIRALSELKKNKSSDADKRESVYARHLVYGDDIYAFEQYFRLCEKHGESEVALLCPRPLYFTKDSSLSDLLPMGPSQLRGRDNINAFKDQFPSVRIKENEVPSVFAKEGTLRAFGGRSKGEPMLFGEEFYSAPKADFIDDELTAYSELFSATLKRENVLQKLLEVAHTDLPLRAYILSEPTDLIENANWRLEAGSGKDYHCENLYWCEAPQTFLDLCENKNKLSDKTIEAIEKTSGPCTLYYRMELEKPFAEEASSVFLPLSYTHEWGHFIGDFKTDNGKNRAEFLSFVEKEATTEEEISKKFRLFKKNLEKIFPEITSQIVREWIVLSEQSACQNVDDSLVEEIKKSGLKVVFVSHSAPLEFFEKSDESLGYSTKKLSHLVRGLLSIRK